MTRGKSSSTVTAMYGNDLSSRSRTLNGGRWRLTRFCSRCSASTSVCGDDHLDRRRPASGSCAIAGRVSPSRPGSSCARAAAATSPCRRRGPRPARRGRGRRPASRGSALQLAARRASFAGHRVASGYPAPPGSWIALRRAAAGVAICCSSSRRARGRGSRRAVPAMLVGAAEDIRQAARPRRSRTRTRSTAAPRPGLDSLTARRRRWRHGQTRASARATRRCLANARRAPRSSRDACLRLVYRLGSSATPRTAGAGASSPRSPRTRDARSRIVRDFVVGNEPNLNTLLDAAVRARRHRRRRAGLSRPARAGHTTR